MSDSKVTIFALSKENYYEMSDVTTLSQEDDRVIIDAQLDTNREQCVWILYFVKPVKYFVITAMRGGSDKT